MIANERQYRITKAARRRFEEALAAHKRSAPRKGVAPRLHKAIADAMQSEIEVLGAQLQRYEDLREGRVSQREIEGLRDLPTALIEARIAAGRPQGELAKRLGIATQQVQRWEASLYSTVGVDRLQEIADALGMKLREQVRYAARATPPSSSSARSPGT